MARKMVVATKEGYEVTFCHGCGATPVRNTPGHEYRHTFNWLVSCSRCSRRCCRDCLPEGEAVCIHCSPKAAA